ncbi:MAG: zinc ribbon domain-containing protein [Armatimonadetes bacterium]|nr:zinc ribbon domain-containing protein [Armatimonadota bacterium]
MPTYVYECKTCEKTFEVEQRITENALTDCSCGASGSLRRLIQPTAMMFKGSGFYVNDMAGVSSAKSERADCTGTPATCPCSAGPEPS